MFDRVGDVDGRNRGEVLAGTLSGAMMQGDGFHDRIGESPQSQEIGADFGVGAAEYFLFSLPIRQWLFLLKSKRGAELIRKSGDQHEFPDIMQQAGEEGLIDEMSV